MYLGALSFIWHLLETYFFYKLGIVGNAMTNHVMTKTNQGDKAC